MKRRWLVPEVVQTSGMDCGPACLTSIVRGFGLDASYGRLREACQTNVDGTSIDTIEEIIGELGLEGAQAILPVEHLLSPYGIVPGIVVARQPVGAPHFIVLWNRRFGRAQVMDPAKGRRWVRPEELERELYIHEMALPAETWRELATEPAFCGPLELRVRALGVADPAAYLERALADESWRGLAVLDAGTRVVETVIASKGASKGREAQKLLDGLIAAPSSIAKRYWFARESDNPEELMVRGCVQLRVTGLVEGAATTSTLDARVAQPEPDVWKALVATMFADRRASALAFALIAALAAVGVVFETALYRVMFEAGSELVTRPQLIGALVVLLRKRPG